MLYSLGAAFADESPSVSFVAGFERFARHQEVDATVGGHLLLTELNCTACHEAESADLKPKLGPRLNGAGSRLGHQWIKRFLASPQNEKPGTTMPDLLAGFTKDERQNAAAALAAFLSTQQEPFPDIKGTGARGVPHEFWKHGSVDRGRQLYHQIGCVACHEADKDYETVETKPTPLDQLLKQLDAEELEEMGLATAARRIESIPHANLSAKYSRQSLTYFLLDPHVSRPEGRMPNLKLGVVEAADIAEWLFKRSESSSRRETVPTSPGSPTKTENAFDADVIAQGRRLFSELGCVNCHTVKQSARGKMFKPLAELNMAATQNCVGTAAKGVPHFRLDKVQTAALKSALIDIAGAARSTKRGGTDSDKLAAANRKVDMRLLQLNCVACHVRNDKGGVGRYRRPYFETIGNVDIGDEGRLPPPLTGVGKKLQSKWLARVLKGTGDVRPHMRIRMPIFSTEQTKPLPELFANAENSSDRQPSEKEVFGDVGPLEAAGRLLLDTGCVQCHSFRGEAVPGVVGIDLDGTSSRVNPQWFHEFLLNPGKLKQRTRMPTFFPGGKSQNAKILDGDANRQIAAMWVYLKNMNRLDLPAKIEKARSQNYELVPKDRPIVLRSFMEHAGTHAIAVGFPERVHFAFDAEQVRLASAWRGRFLDAQGTWFVRFAPPAEPLGDQQVVFPPGVPFALVTNQEFPNPSFDAKNADYRFRGYRLDKSGVPTFLYQFDRFDIEERIKPVAENNLIRQLTITDRTPGQPSASLWFRGHSGKSLKNVGLHSYTNDVGVSMTVTKGLKNGGELNAGEDGTHWIVPVIVEPKQTIEVDYRW